MDKYEATFEILYIAAGIDGEVDDSEISVIKHFLETHQESLEFDIENSINNIDMLNVDGKVEEFAKAAQVFNNDTTVQDKRLLLDFMVSLIAADDEITDSEEALLNLLADIINIDLNKYLNFRT